MKTLPEQEKLLEDYLVRKMVSFESVKGKIITGKVQRCTVNNLRGEVLYTIIVDRDRFEYDLEYWKEHLIVFNGNSQGDNAGNDIWGLLESD